VTREEHDISWETTQGSIPLVNIEYSKDDFSDDIHTIVSSYDNTVSPNSYTWAIPDDRSTTVKVRVSDVRDVTVNDVSDDYFTIDYYSVTFEIRDLLTNEHLSQLSVDAASDKGDVWQTSEDPQVPGQPLGSPVTVELPYGFWTFTWMKTGYGDKQVSFLLDKDDPLAGTENEVIFMETTAIHIWRAYSDFAYDPTADKLSVTSWLERDGFVVTGGVQADVYIYDPTDGSLVQQLTDTSPDSAGFFHSEWSPTTLVAGKVYSIITDITNASGAHFKTPDSFTITEETKLQDVQDTVNAVLDKPISEVNTELQQTLQQQTDTITEIMVGEEKTPEEVIAEGGMVGMIEQSLQEFEQTTQEAISDLQLGAEQAVAAGKELYKTAKKFSWSATVAPDPAKVNSTVTITVQGPLEYDDPETPEEDPQPTQPILNLYSWDNKPLIVNQPLIKTAEGVFTYSFVVDKKFTAGQAYTYVVTESLTGGLVSGSGMVELSGWKATLAPDPVLAGDTVTLTVQGLPDLEPKVSIYRWDDEVILQDEVMEESTTNPGVYTFKFTADERFPVGKAYTYLVTEERSSARIMGSGMVEEMSITTVAGLAASAPEAERAAKDALEAIKAVELALGADDGTSIALTLKNLQESVEKLPEIIAREGPSAKVIKAINDMSEKLNELASKEGFDFSELLEEKLAESPTVRQ
ncbi:MAG: hypothetical protein DRP69_06395, partial [Candidatus Duberdicusella sinuisediminis]